MRGFPLLQLLIVALLFVAAGVPVWSLTRPIAVAVTSPVVPAIEAATPAPNALTPLSIQAEFAPAPTDFEIRCQDQVVLQGHGPGRQFSTQWKTAVPKEGVDFVVRARWPAEAEATAGPAAARLTVSLPAGSKVERSFWTAPGQALAEVVTIPGFSAVPKTTP